MSWGLRKRLIGCNIAALRFMAAKASKPESEMTFETAVERLEAIVEAMETAGKGPETSILTQKTT